MEKKEIGTMREKEFKDALQESREYLSDYICVSKDVIRAIQRHAKRYGIMPGICAWYLDWEDFCSDWCDQCGYTRTQARKLLHGGIGGISGFAKWKRNNPVYIVRGENYE